MKSIIACLIVATVSAFELTCPSGRGWNIRALTQCPNGKIHNYTCLFDEVEHKYTETCSGPKFDREGHKKNINKGNFNRAKCSSELYQPVKFSTIGHSDCLFLKSSCSEEGQIVVDNGTAMVDRKCRCDYSKGYAFISNPDPPCNCTPSEEDCSCYRKRCGPDEVLSPDYECVDEIEKQDKYQCLFLLTTNKIIPEDSVEARALSEELYDTVYIWSAFILVSSGIILFTALAVILLFRGKEIENDLYVWCQSIRNRLKKLEIVTPLKHPVRCVEGQNVTLACTVNKKHMKSKWKKDGVEIFSLRSENMTHTLIIDNISNENRGNYTVKFNSLTFSNALVIVTVAEYSIELKLKINFSKELENKDSVAFKKLSNEIAKAVTELYSNVKEMQDVKVVQFQPGLLVTLTMTSSHSYEANADKLRNVLKDSRGSIPPFETLSTEYSFTYTGRPYSGIKDVVAQLCDVLVEIHMDFPKVLLLPIQGLPLSNSKKKVSSEDFDIRLMMILMKNLSQRQISDVLPYGPDVSVSADLSRIKLYRNKVRQNNDKALTDDEFSKDSDDIREALVRLGGDNYKKICNDIKKHNPSPQQCEEFLANHSLQPDSRRASIDSSEDFFLEHANLIRDARKAVREKFDERIPPHRLKEEISKQRKYLHDLRANKKITQSQWQALYPEAGDPSSKRLDIRIMKFLLELTDFKDSQIFKAIENLCSHFSKPELDYDAVSVRKEIKFIEEN